ncbi:ATP-binding protein [Sphingomonas sp. NBWT7]|uniref:AAA family ATPase n=1 Tax=Sphingomonas sp. NBWT7 TaxID=2596913 RepID=UPI001C64224C|nr:ATP-binding protein [Sphingomonas sp. NBWT7]
MRQDRRRQIDAPSQIARARHTNLVAEDHWLANLYPGEQSTLADYVHNAARLRAAIGPHLVDLLRTGVSAVLDFPAITAASRAWMRALAEQAGCAHQLLYLDVPDAICLERLHRRNRASPHQLAVSEADFALFAARFVAPSADKGLDIVVHRT